MSERAPVRQVSVKPGADQGLRRLTVHGWFVVMIAAVSVLVVACVVIATVMLDRTARLSDQVILRISPARIEAAQLRSTLIDQETGVRGFLLTGNDDLLEPYTAGIEAERRSRERIAALIGDRPELVGELNAVRDAAAAWRRDYAEPLTADRRADGAIPASRIESGKHAFDQIRTLLDRQDDRLAKARRLAQEELEQVERVRNLAFVVMLILFLMAGVAMAVLLRRAIGRPLDELREAARDIAAGDFDRVIPVSGPADIREVARDVESMRTKIVDALGESRQQHVLLREQAAGLDAQAEELRRSNAELEQFAYVASHDLQEPLRKIATFCQLLQKRYGDVLDERGLQYIHFAVDGATRMQVLINDLLTFSRVGRLYDDRKPVELEEALEKALVDLSAVIEENGAQIERLDPLPRVIGDPTMLGMLWQNLVGNALKFRAPDRVPRVTITCEQRENDWLFAVSDNGIGVDAEFADKIFVIFQRLHSREAYTGTGIGLAMCKKIVENHGGTIWLDTGYTEGARISFTLPAVTDEGAPA
ncbi:CHASE3 domain-containing protein [Nonomuraea sp. WAC 01424]|uniref:sensor histidine kinase n=1 Tax=Nonomuraea sp. WAC 01424 TaxID=2203200 RepID=UPI0021ADEB25|nr:CHASE3 domain-containing protein [Nonomuraea sp. WAC 01424]